MQVVWGKYEVCDQALCPRFAHGIRFSRSNTHVVHKKFQSNSCIVWSLLLVLLEFSPECSGFSSMSRSGRSKLLSLIKQSLDIFGITDSTIFTGWWFQPLWKVWARQLGSWNSQYDGKKNPNVPVTTNQFGYITDSYSFLLPFQFYCPTYHPLKLWRRFYHELSLDVARESSSVNGELFPLAQNDVILMQCEAPQL